MPVTHNFQSRKTFFQPQRKPQGIFIKSVDMGNGMHFYIFFQRKILHQPIAGYFLKLHKLRAGKTRIL